jgi:two-component system, LytTR family, sensor kinase
MRSRLRSSLRTLLILTGAFLGVTLFFTTANFVVYLFQASGYRLSLGQHFLLFADRWMPWALLAPGAIGVARLFPLRGRRWPLHVPVQLAGAVALSWLVSSASVVLYRYALKGPIGLPDGLAPHLGDFRLTFLNQLHINLIAFFVISVFVWGLDYLRLFREKERAAGRLEAELARANLQVLKSQVHPHFLFNTLHMISAMVYEDPGKADGMISRLSDLLRAALARPDTPTVPLKTELEILSLYVDIMKARFGERLAVNFEVAPDALPALVPTFSLQPLVENAIKYGIMPRDRGGEITISARRDVGRLVLGVSDDGIGFRDRSAVLRTGGIGLKNIQGRLSGLYGDDGVMRIENRSDGGAQVALDIPFRTASDREEGPA